MPISAVTSAITIKAMEIASRAKKRRMKLTASDQETQEHAHAENDQRALHRPFFHLFHEAFGARSRFAPAALGGLAESLRRLGAAVPRRVLHDLGDLGKVCAQNLQFGDQGL